MAFRIDGCHALLLRPDKAPEGDTATALSALPIHQWDMWVVNDFENNPVPPAGFSQAAVKGLLAACEFT
eukprot:6856025-Lingulodinium_polyedra.AAC.1